MSTLKVITTDRYVYNVKENVNVDEKLMESYLNGKEISETDLISCIRKGCINFDFVPVLTGSAFKKTRF